jgi:DMSO reductase anchor subunit
MHPALSVIIFTVLSGAGYGLLALIGLFAAAGLLPGDRGLGVAALAVGLAAVATGLVASTGHLGRPERGWRALSQWRSSWLSREGVAALVSFLPAGLLLLALLFGRGGWTVPLLGLLTAILAAATVWCTAMIYRSLKPIRQWHHPLVVANYLALALMTGALWFYALASLWRSELAPAQWIALAAIVAAAALKRAYWAAIDRGRPIATIESATGLHQAPVRLFEAPHTQDNYLLKEMGFRLARKHRARLRRIALVLGYALPFLLTAIAALWPLAAPAIAILAALLAIVGVLVERWLFFAEAKHTVTLYYGADTV